MNAQNIEAVATLDRHFIVEVADSQEALREAQRLRHQVYCLERKLLPERTAERLETDEYDATSHHVVLRQRRNGEVVGTARLVLGERGAGGCPSGLPMLHYCSPELLRDLPMGTTAEISRFAISKARRQVGDTSDRLLRYALMRGILSVSLELRLTHWCALMEPSLLRMLRSAGVSFMPLGPAVDCSGLRLPSAATVGSTLLSGSHRCPDLYRFVARTQAVVRQEEVLSAA
jgi:N-acyl-L-homoserine lactone synthetase